MHHIREILRLSRESGLSQNQISKTLGLSKGVVQKTLSTFLKSKLPWPFPDGMADADVAAALWAAIDRRSTGVWSSDFGGFDNRARYRSTSRETDDLDHAAQFPSFGSKMGIDGTRKWPEEGFTRRWPELIEMSPEVKAKVDGMWKSLGIEKET